MVKHGQRLFMPFYNIANFFHNICLFACVHPARKPLNAVFIQGIKSEVNPNTESARSNGLVIHVE